MPQVGLRKAPQRRRKDNVKSHLMMDMKEGDNGFYEEKFSSRSRYSSKDKKKHYSTKIAEDENGLVYGEKWSLLSSSRPLEKDSSCTGMDRFWDGQCPPEGKDWAVVNALSQKMLNDGRNLVLSMEGGQSPSASESSSSLSTRDSSSFSATSEASSARRESLQSAANPSARFSDFSFLSSHAPQLAAISMQKATGTDRTLEQNSVQSYRYECRKQQKGQDLFKLRSHEEKIVRNPDVLQSAVSQQDKQNSYLDYSGPLGLDGVEFDTAINFEEKILIAVNDQVHASLECLDEGCSSDSSSSTHSWASAYSQEFSSESRWQSCNAIHESEDLLNHDDGRSNPACQTEGGDHIDFQHADIENVESFRRVQPPSSAGEVQQPSHYTFYGKSANALREGNSELCGSRVSTGARICASLNGSEFMTYNSEVLCEGQTFHMSDTLHPGYDRMGNATSPSAATFSTISSWVPTSVPNLHGNSGDWKSSSGHGMLQPAPRTIQPDDARLISTSQPSYVCENVTHMKAMDPEFGLHTQILDACKKASKDCVRFSEKPVNGSPQVPWELPEAMTNRLIPSSQSTLRAWRREKYPPIPAVEKTSGLCKPLLPTTQTTARVPFVEAVGHIKPLPSAGLKCGHSAAVKENFPSTSLHGYVRFMEQGGLLCCTFFVNDSDEVLFARACKPEKWSDKENCDWIYTFHSRRDDGKVKYAWKGWGKKETMASELVGKMRVSHVRHTDNIRSSKKGTKETQFILFNARGQHSLETQTARVDNIPNRPASEFLKPVVDEGISPLLNASVLTGSQFKHVYQRATPNSLNDVPNLSNGNIASELQRLDCIEEGRLKQRIDVPKETRDASRLKGSTLEQSKTFKSHVELAAIVISTEVENLNQSKSRNPVQKETVGWGVKFLEKDSGNGWGLKFLEKKPINNHSREAGLDVRETQADPCIRSKESECDETLGDSRNFVPYDQQLRKPKSGKEGCFNKSESFVYRSDVISADNKELERENRRIKASVDVTVILPAGGHGLPTGDSDMPTPLVERWRSGGNCECGGWDLGCGLSIFSTETLNVHGAGGNIALTSQDRINWLSPGQPLKIFAQGYRRKGALRVEQIETGLFSLRFKARFSPLQAFATAVAILHQQITQR